MNFIPNEQPPIKDSNFVAWLNRLIDYANSGLRSTLNPYSINTVVDNFTCFNKQVIICKNTIAINVTLPDSSKIGDDLYVKRRGASTVTIIGTVDGAANPTLASNECLHLMYDGTDWNSI